MEQQKPQTTATSTPEKQAAAKPKAGKTYRVLQPGDHIARCTYMLPNQLQCWKAGEEEITNVTAEGETFVYQLCERHVRIQKAIDAGLLKSENLNTPEKEATTPIPPVPEQEAKTPPQGEQKKETEQQQEEDKKHGEEGNRPFFKKESEVHAVRKEGEK